MGLGQSSQNHFDTLGKLVVVHEPHRDYFYHMANDYQGSIRYAFMDPIKISAIIANEATSLAMIYGDGATHLNKQIAITCQDQMITTNVPIISTSAPSNWVSRFDFDFSACDVIKMVDIASLKSMLI